MSWKGSTNQLGIISSTHQSRRPSPRTSAGAARRGGDPSGLPRLSEIRRGRVYYRKKNRKIKHESTQSSAVSHFRYG